jgi:hypothetical protein
MSEEEGEEDTESVGEAEKRIKTHASQTARKR